LTQPQVDAVRQIYAGFRDPQTNQLAFAGYEPGSENSGGQSWRTYFLDPPEPMRLDFFRFFLFHDPNWDWHTLDFSGDLAYADTQLGFMNATNPDISAFTHRGGKLLLFAGWADPVVPPQDTIAYYGAVSAAMGGPAKISSSVRLFMVPGMAHCGGGPGPNLFDALGALDEWVTQNKPPARIFASHVSAGGKIDRTRPLCAYPQVARYRGSGSIDDADRFTCAPPPPK